MKANTRLFGEIDIADDKIISLEDGMIGLPEYRNFALIFDEEKEKDKSSVMWFQSMDDPQTAFPVMQPNHVCPDYNPMVSDEMLRPLGGMTGQYLRARHTYGSAGSEGYLGEPQGADCH